MVAATHALVFLALICGAAAIHQEQQCCEVPCCPSGWTQFGSRCFTFYNNPLTWIEAEKFCLGIGGNLASIRNDGEHEFLKDYVRTLTGSLRAVWVGAYDAVKEGVWLWTDGYDMEYTQWFSGEPNNLNGNEHCLSTNWFGDFWNDWKCSNILSYMCSKDMKPVSPNPQTLPPSYLYSP